MTTKQKIERYTAGACRRQLWTDEEIDIAAVFAPPSAEKVALYERKRAEKRAAAEVNAAR